MGLNSDLEHLGSSAAAWLEREVPGYRGSAPIEKFAFGQSSSTYRLTSPSGGYLLRRKSFGPLLPKAHAIEREYHVLSALGGSDVPAPPVPAFCHDPTILGSAIYVIAFVDGRIFYDQRLPGMTPPERAAIFDAMNEAVAAPHSLEPGSVGLVDFSRAEASVARQVGVSIKQYRLSDGERCDPMEFLIEWLPDHLPPDQPAHIFHGDLRLDNMIFHATQPRVIALLDWELSMVGVPLADFAYHAFVWRVGADPFRGVGDLDRSSLGVPEEGDCARRYCERTGRVSIPHWNFYLVFSLFASRRSCRESGGAARMDRLAPPMRRKWKRRSNRFRGSVGKPPAMPPANAIQFQGRAEAAAIF